MVSLPSITEHWKSLYSALTIWVSLFGIPYFFYDDPKTLCAPSRTPSRNQQRGYTYIVVAFHSLACCRVFLRMNSCTSLETRLFVSKYAVYARGSKVTSLQLPHSCKLPFLRIFQISPLVHSFGTFSSLHIWSKGDSEFLAGLA